MPTCVVPVNWFIYEALMDKAASYPADQPFKARAYRRVAESVLACTENLYQKFRNTPWNINLPHAGLSTLDFIEDYIERTKDKICDDCGTEPHICCCLGPVTYPDEKEETVPTGSFASVPPTAQRQTALGGSGIPALLLNPWPAAVGGSGAPAPPTIQRQTAEGSQVPSTRSALVTAILAAPVNKPLTVAQIAEILKINLPKKTPTCAEPANQVIYQALIDRADWLKNQAAQYKEVALSLLTYQESLFSIYSDKKDDMTSYILDENALEGISSEIAEYIHSKVEALSSTETCNNCGTVPRCYCGYPC
jgi:hypothetical protein